MIQSRLSGLLLVGFVGADPRADTLALVRGGVAGLLFAARNIASQEQLGILTRRLIAERDDGLLLAIDQEPGRVARLQKITGETPSARALGGLNDRETFRWGAGIGRQIMRFGLNVDLAPVLDVTDADARGVIGDRSFGADPIRVASAGVAFIRGLHAAGVRAVAKHFPGHGSTVKDSHHEVAVVDLPLSCICAHEVVPFRQAVRAGVQAVMVGHLLVPAVDARRPSSLSPAVYRLLREEVGFRGVAITDALEMESIALMWDLPIAAELAVRAGADLVLIARSPDRVPEVVELLDHAVRSGRLPSRRVEEALARNARFKRFASRQQRH